VSSTPLWPIYQLSPCRASLWGRTNDQVPDEQVCEVGQTSKSSSSKFVRRGQQPSPRRASLRGRANDQVPAEQVCETGWPTKSLPSKSTRQDERPSPRRTDSQERNMGQHCRPTTRHNITKPRLDRTYSSKRSLADTMEHPRVRRRTYPHWLAGSINSSRGDLITGVSTVAHTPERMRQYPILGVYLRTLDSDVWGMAKDEAVLNRTLNLVVSPLRGTRQVPQRWHRASYKDSYRERTRWNAILGARQCTTLRTTLGGLTIRRQQAVTTPSRIRVPTVKPTLEL
jgi:hypothetical protein